MGSDPVCKDCGHPKELPMESGFKAPEGVFACPLCGNYPTSKEDRDNGGICICCRVRHLTYHDDTSCRRCGRPVRLWEVAVQHTDCKILSPHEPHPYRPMPWPMVPFSPDYTFECPGIKAEVEEEPSTPASDDPKRRRPFFCWLGIHSWFVDRAEFSRALRCNSCSAYKDEQAGKRLEFERELWEWADANYPPEGLRELVQRNLVGWDYLQARRND